VDTHAVAPERQLLTSYRDFAATLIAEGVLSDPWVDGAPRFRMTPIAIDRATQRALYAAAEGVTEVHAEAARLCAAKPALLRRYLDLPPSYRLMWESSAPAWHGLARADVFLTADGPRVCELNSDTPSGEAEAIALNRVLGGAGTFLEDPNRELGARVAALVEAAYGRVARLQHPEAKRGAHASAPPRHVAIVYPTELTDDLCVIETYARWFEARGFRVVLGSPFNLLPDGAGGVSMFGVPCPVVWRHYKTDWWGERRPIWRSEPAYADAAPLSGPLAWLAGAVAGGRCAVVNPFGAVVTQNKRLMALMWEELGDFSPRARQLIRRYLPLTVRMETLAAGRLREERRAWVLKSDYGCEGEEVVIGAETSPEAWSRAVAEALPGRWIAQRRFEALKVSGGGRKATVANHGVYVVAGRATGLFTRLHEGATDRLAQAVPTFIRLPA
jgi:hypothetical protein